MMAMENALTHHGPRNEIDQTPLTDQAVTQDGKMRLR
jgi:hypothetical protein